MKSGTRIPWRRMACLAAVALFGTLAVAPAAATPPSDGTDLYVPPAQPGARRQIARLTAQGDRAAAAQIRAITDTPQAVWFEAGTPDRCAGTSGSRSPGRRPIARSPCS